MNYKSEITVSTTAVIGKKYPIYKSDFKIGDAEFLKKDGDLFEFDIHLSSANPTNYQYKFDVDSSTYELVSMRAIPK
jgi:hypothetical protein